MAQGATSFTIRTASDRREIDHYLRAHPGATVYHLGRFSQAIDSAFGKSTICLEARSAAGAVCGALPLVPVGNRLLGRRLVSMPYANHGGALADSTEIEEALVRAAVAEAEKLGRQLELRETQPRTGLDAATGKVIMELELPETEDELGKSIGAKRRSQVRRPLRENPEIRHGGAGLVDEFYQVFSHNMRDLGTPVYPSRFFTALVEALGDDVHIVIVRLDQQPVAGAFLIGFRDRVEIPWAASLREFNRIGVNMLLYWEALTWAIGQKFRIFDFGRSTPGEGTWRFKKQWGAEPVQCYWNRWPADAGDGRGRMTDLAVRAWQRLPVWCTNRLGPLISPDLPW